MTLDALNELDAILTELDEEMARVERERRVVLILVALQTLILVGVVFAPLLW